MERTPLTLELPTDTLYQLMLMAHERDVTLNDLINDVLKSYIEANPLPENSSVQESYICAFELLENGDAMLKLPDAVVEKTGWKVGDTVYWKDLGDGTFELSSTPD